MVQEKVWEALVEVHGARIISPDRVRGDPPARRLVPPDLLVGSGFGSDASLANGVSDGEYVSRT